MLDTLDFLYGDHTSGTAKPRATCADLGAVAWVHQTALGESQRVLRSRRAQPTGGAAVQGLLNVKTYEGYLTGI